VKSFNYSALTTALRCNQLFKYLYVDKITPEGPDSGDMKFGTAIHMGVEGILMGGTGLEDFELFWDVEKSKDNKFGRYGWQELREQGLTLLSRFERLHAKKFNVYQMEQRLYGSIGDIRVEGTPDFVGEFEGKKSIVDFKTSGTRYNKNKIKTAEQLMLYAHLAEQQLAYKAEQIVYVVFVKGSTPSIQCLSASLTRDSLNDILENVKRTALDLINKQESGSFIKNRSNCVMGENTCQFFEKCYPLIKEQ
jgi:hypothetical protein